MTSRGWWWCFWIWTVPFAAIMWKLGGFTSEGGRLLSFIVLFPAWIVPAVILFTLALRPARATPPKRPTPPLPPLTSHDANAPSASDR